MRQIVEEKQKQHKRLHNKHQKLIVDLEDMRSIADEKHELHNEVTNENLILRRNIARLRKTVAAKETENAQLREQL